MIPPNETKTPIKMAGYLEKKSKMRVVCRWKKLWFVLEGRLLLYYKSQLEYLSLSPCRGTVNMGLAASVLPGASQEIIVSTRSHTVSLRALSRTDHDIWLQALIDAMCLPNSSHIRCCPKPLHHFRYSSALDQSRNESTYNIPGHASTLPTASSLYSKNVWRGSGGSTEPKRSEKYGQIEPRNDRNLKTDSSLNRKADLLKKSNKVALSDTSIPGKFKLSSQETNSKTMRRSFSVEDEVNKYGENIYESLKSVDCNMTNKQPKRNMRVNRSDSDCLTMSPREKALKNQQFNSDRRRRNNGLDMKAYTLLGTKERNFPGDRFSSIDPQWTLLGWSSGYGTKVRSDTDLSMHKGKHNYDQPLSSSYDFANLRELIREKTSAPVPLPRTLNKRSNSLLRHFSPQTPRTNGRRMSVKKRSLSFLKKIWCRKESNKWEPGPVPIHNPCDYLQEMEGPESELEIVSDMSDCDLNINYKLPRPEPPPDYDNVNVSDDEMEMIHRKGKQPDLPPRLKKIKQKYSEEIKRPCSPWHDVPRNNKPVNSPEPEPFQSNTSWSLEAPELPPKTATCIDNAKDLLSQDTDNGLARLFAEDSSNSPSGKKDTPAPLYRKKDELLEMLENLTTINKTPLIFSSIYQNTHDIYEEVKKLKHREANRRNKEDPDYDVPRPHVSLLPSLKQASIATDSLQATRFFTGHFEDSLDVSARETKEELAMAPDSLECDPWSLSEEMEIEDPWTFHQRQIHMHPMAIDSLYQDSLNPPIAPLVAGVIGDYIPRPEYIHAPHNLKIS